MFNREYLSIGEVSKIKNISIKALRYYHEKGIFIPAYINPENGYRYYSVDQFIHLDLIKICKDYRLSIKEISELFKSKKDESIKTFLTKKSVEIHKEMEELKNKLSLISTLSTTMDEDLEEETKEQMYVRHFEERYIFKVSTSSDEMEEIYSFESLEKLIQQLFIDSTFRYGLMYSHHIVNDRQTRYVFCELTKQDYLNNKDSDQIDCLPAGNYLVINCRKQDEDESLNKVIEYMKKNKITQHNIYMFYLVKDVFNTDNHFSQFQLCIEKKPPF